MLQDGKILNHIWRKLEKSSLLTFSLLLVVQRCGVCNKGLGVVEYATEESAQKAINELNQTDMGGRSIFVREVLCSQIRIKNKTVTTEVDPQSAVLGYALAPEIDQFLAAVEFLSPIYHLKPDGRISKITSEKVSFLSIFKIPVKF